MYRSLIIFLACQLLLVGCSSPGQEPLEADTEVNNNVAYIDNMQAAKEAFAAQYPEAEEVSWDEDANGYYEASFEIADTKYRADYTKEGNWIETESSLDYDELPEAVKNTVKSGFDKDDITEIEKVDNASRGLFYDVEFKAKGKNRDVEIRENGEIIKE